ncbi:hypothetical protein K461DRAFT_314576 [Myriangium duriaei CBS 260.36]|uniref:Dystroglycan-type cadherin-like domain-containing protein n=1 Tax=Myriangium duriaei CBS 260.36 TaxID=1168546 RepID=A0A9P4IV98_9PEZI|nr:hypothetical protein K461DRAFT_314576 [Myriangium duriaei CBS 260.36]
MNCTLVVTDNVPPQLAQDLSPQMQLSGRLSAPATMSIYPGDSFNLHFSQQTFEPGSIPILAYYATLINGAPLPSWIYFDPSAISFSGTAPDFGGIRQTIDVALIAADVLGFEGSRATFSLSITQNRLAFEPQTEVYHVNDNLSIQYALSQPLSTSAALASTQFIHAQITGPSWINFDNKSLVISGQAPQDFTTERLNVSVTDTYGNSAEKTIILQRLGHGYDDLGQSGAPDFTFNNITAAPGQNFNYTLPAALANSISEITVSFSPPQQWLEYRTATTPIQGNIPQQLKVNNVRVELRMVTQTSAAVVNRSFFINISVANMSVSAALPNPSKISGDPGISATDPGKHLSKKSIAIFVSCTLGPTVLLALLFAVLIRKWRKGPFAIDKGHISGPIINPEDEWRFKGKLGKVIDLTRADTSEFSEKAPHICLEVMSSPVKTSPPRMNRASATSSIGAGEETIKADHNIPLWGQTDVARLPLHDSHSVATQASLSPSSASNHSRAIKRASATIRILPGSHSKRSSLSASLSRLAQENRRNIRLISKTEADHRSFVEKRQLYSRKRASDRSPSLLFTMSSRSSYHSRQDKQPNVDTRPDLLLWNPSPSANGSPDSPLFTVEPPDQIKSPLSARSSLYSASSIIGPDLAAEMALPRHQRSWVLPCEASPTPPPADTAADQVATHSLWAQKLDRRNQIPTTSSSLSQSNDLGLEIVEPLVVTPQSTGERVPLATINRENLTSSGRRGVSWAKEMRRQSSFMSVGGDENGKENGRGKAVGSVAGYRYTVHQGSSSSLFSTAFL